MIQHYEDVKSAGRAAILEKRKADESKAKFAAGKSARARALESNVRSAIASLDVNGRWIAKYRGEDQIRTATFIANMRTLADYVEAVK